MNIGMGCRSFNGSKCLVSGESCMFFIPNSKRCAELYGEGPDALTEKCEACKDFYYIDGKRCCRTRPYLPVFAGDPPKTDFLEDNTACCGGFKKK